MKKFLLSILELGSILLIITFSIEILLLFVPNCYSYKREYIESHIDDISILLLGNSHVAHNINPKYIGNGVFNTAIQGRPVVFDVEMAKRYVPEMKSLKIVIMPLDYFRFYFGRDRYNPRDIRPTLTTFYENTIRCMYYKYMGFRIDNVLYWSEFVNSKEDYIARLFKNKEEAIECDSLGYFKLKSSTQRVAGWEYRCLPQLIDSTKKKDMDLYMVLFDQYKELAAITSQNDVKLILLGTPVFQTYQADMNKGVLVEMQEFVDSLQSIYSNIEYIDYSFDDRFLPEDFSDASHLSFEGAKKLSEIIKKEIIDVN